MLTEQEKATLEGLRAEAQKRELSKAEKQQLEALEEKESE